MTRSTRFYARLGGFAEGPFERLDRVGLNVEHETTTRVWRTLDQPPRLAPQATLQRLIAANHLGRATQRGFYAYDGPYALPAVPVDRRNFDCPPAVYKAVRLVCDAATTEGGSFTEQYVFARTLIALINEAALLADQQPAAETQIDELMTAAGLPRGPLAWAAQIGRHTCATLLRRLNTSPDNCYTPAIWLAS